jgi:hypothetical protein
MAKIEKRQVDDRLPKWLHSRFLSAIDYIWQSHGNAEESVRRVKQVDESGVFTDEEMNWVLMLLILPKLKNMVASSDDYKNFQTMKKATRH